MTDLTVINGRLTRRNKKLQQQRDAWKKRYEELRIVLDQFPMYEKRYSDLRQWKLALAEESALKARVKEQAALLERLLREGANNGE